MTTMIERMRANQASRQKSYQTDHSIFIHWKIPVNGSCVLRFIPFEDPRSLGYWTERKMIPVTFIDPDDDTKLVHYDIPCLEMYHKTGEVYCPALQPVRDLYSEAKELKSVGNTQDSERIHGIAGAHWLKFTAYYQGWVIKPGYEEENTPENPIRIFPLTKQIHKVIYNSVFKNEIDPYDKLPTGEYTVDDVHLAMNLPDDYPDDDLQRLWERFHGRNFNVQRLETGEADKKQNKWDGANTGWARDPQPLTEEQLSSIEEYGLHDLGKRLPERPSDAAYEVMVEMVKTSIARLMGTDDGYWNKEWEIEGIKPFKERGKKGGDKKPAAGSAAGSRVRQKLTGDAPKGDSDGGSDDSPKTSATTSVRDKLDKMKRGATAPAPKEDEPAAAAAPAEEPAAEPVADEATADDKKARFAALNARIRQKVEKQSPAEG